MMTTARGFLLATSSLVLAANAWCSRTTSNHRLTTGLERPTTWYPTAWRSYQTPVDLYYQQHGELPWPNEPHAVLDLRSNSSGNDEKNQSILIIGDVHGCYDELMELVAQVEQEYSLRWIILVGDLVNKGPKSAKVVQHVRTHADTWRAVRGNHDNAALKASCGDGKRRGKTKYSWVQDLTDSDICWMAELPYTLRIPKETLGDEKVDRDILVVHAGLEPHVDLHQQSVEAMTTLRKVTLDESREPVPWASAWKGPERVVFGHDAIQGLQLYDLFATGLDSGCVYGKELTGLVLPENKLVSIKAHKEHCPVG